MEGLTMDMSNSGIGGSMFGLKGSLETQKNAVGQLMAGAQQPTAGIAGEGPNAARSAMMRDAGVGQKLDIMA